MKELNCLLPILLMLVSISSTPLYGQTDGTRAVDSEINYQELYERGIEYGVFLDEATRRKAMWDNNTDIASVPAQLEDRVAQIASGWRLLVVAVDGCSDSANIIPYLSALTASTDDLDLRIIDSTLGRAVMEANRTPDGRAATPTIAVLNESFEPVGYLIERPEALQNWALENKSELSSREFMNQKFAWYDEDRGHSSMEAILNVIEQAEGR